jgi:hypothetical protein
MNSSFRTTALGVVFGASLMAVAAVGVAQAEPAPLPPGPDGLVNVLVGGTTFLYSVPDAQAAQAVTDMCAMPAPAVSAMVAEVDAAGGSETACAGRPKGNVVLAENLPAAQEPSPVVPGTKASFGSGSADVNPAGPDPISNSLPTEPDNMSALN